MDTKQGALQVFNASGGVLYKCNVSSVALKGGF